MEWINKKTKEGIKNEIDARDFTTNPLTLEVFSCPPGLVALENTNYPWNIKLILRSFRLSTSSCEHNWPTELTVSATDVPTTSEKSRQPAAESIDLGKV